MNTDSEPTVIIKMTPDQARKHFSALPELFTVEDVAKKYGTSERYVMNEIHDKNLAAFKIAGAWKLTAADVQEWIESKQERTNKQRQLEVMPKRNR